MKNTSTLLEQLMASSSYGCTKNVYNSNVNIKNSDSEFIAEVILPGFSKKDISIFTDDKILEINARKNGRDPAQFKINLNGLVSINNISSKLEDGILNISLPKISAVDRLSISVG
jgi:HSP20 family molecular chaperone IbpA